MAKAGYFVSRWKAALWAAPENSRPPPLPGRRNCEPDRPLKKAVGVVLSGADGKHGHRLNGEDAAAPHSGSS